LALAGRTEAARMVGARTEAGPTAAEAATHTEVALMEEAGRTVRAEAADILVLADRAEAALISATVAAMEDSQADSAEAGRRDIRQWRGRVAAHMEACRHGNQAAIPPGLTAVGVMDARVEAMAADIAALDDRVLAAVHTETLAAMDARHRAETAEPTAAHNKVNAPDRMATRTAVRAADAATIALRRAAAIPG
jgi:hypothetical protein